MFAKLWYNIYMKDRTYVAIDLKSFYASVECVDRGLDPLTTNLVVADESRTEKTICLAVTPSLKAFGIPGRARLFEVVQRVRELNRTRKEPIEYIVAPPRMARYLEVSAQVYNVYLQYIAPEDIHVYSVDEVFMDVTNYLDTYKMSARDLTMKMIREVLATTGVTATAGIGTNLYLAKIAMDVVAKKMPADKDGVRIAELDEISYRRELWEHRPITDFWRVGRGYAKRLAKYNMFTMGDVALCSLGGANEFYNENLLYREFGVNAELLIDHAWGWEPCTMADIKSYRPSVNSMSSGQVLQHPYSFAKARVVAREMAESMALDLLSKNLVTDQMVLVVGYDIDSLKQPGCRYDGPMAQDGYGRVLPAPVHGSVNLGEATVSARIIVMAIENIFDSVVHPDLLVRRITVVANNVRRKEDVAAPVAEQLDLFVDEAEVAARERFREQLAREEERQRAILDIQQKYGRNAVLKAVDLTEDATAKQRNGQIGGHRA